MSEPIVEVRGLVNRFGAQTVHDGLDMTVERGEVFGIVGGSGSGKSVLLRSILGLQRPQAGEVRLQGRTLNQLNDAELRQTKATYGVTFQQGALFTSLTVLQNGVLVQDHVTIRGFTYGSGEAHVCETGSLRLQDHFHPDVKATFMRFRNIWYRPLD